MKLLAVTIADYNQARGKKYATSFTTVIIILMPLITQQRTLPVRLKAQSKHMPLQLYKPVV
mgnify:CR=1 FL=1